MREITRRVENMGSKHFSWRKREKEGMVFIKKSYEKYYQK